MFVKWLLQRRRLELVNILYLNRGVRGMSVLYLWVDVEGDKAVEEVHVDNRRRRMEIRKGCMEKNETNSNAP